MKIFHDLSNKTGFVAMEKERYLYKIYFYHIVLVWLKK